MPVVLGHATITEIRTLWSIHDLLDYYLTLKEHRKAEQLALERVSRGD
jgi:hypothetical protein